MNIFNTKRVYDAIYKADSKPDRTKTLESWQKRVQTLHNALLKMQEQHEAEMQEASGQYLPSVLAEQETAYKREVKYVVEKRIGELKSDLKTILDGKCEQFRKIALSPPSDEQLRLLTAVSFRNDLSEGEVSRLVEQMGDCHQAIRSLRSIAKRSGVDVINPIGVEEFEESIEKANLFCEDMLRQVETKSTNLSYDAKCFFEYNGVGKANMLFNELDTALYSAVQKEPRKPLPEPQTVAQEAGTNHPSPNEADEFWSEVKSRGCENLHSVAEQFHVTQQAIREANPGRDLSRFYAGDCFLIPSTKYSFRPGGTSVQPEQVKAVPKPVWKEPAGPNGEQIGEDISITDVPTSGH